MKKCTLVLPLVLGACGPALDHNLPSNRNHVHGYQPQVGYCHNHGDQTHCGHWHEYKYSHPKYHPKRELIYERICFYERVFNYEHRVYERIKRCEHR